MTSTATQHPQPNPRLIRARAGFAVLAALALVSPAHADIYDEAEIDVSTYQVTGSSLAEVQAQMESGGPKGYWAFTNWYANWNGACETSVTAEITMPELADDADLTEVQAEEFDRMATALLDHELGHVRIGLNFAEAVADAGCPANTKRIHASFTQAGIDYDDETEHGYQQGVYLVEP
ncbi:MAG: hypothetical protein JWS10_1850 [Cypionkella sp.]|uniref:DUF922 domain-containing protein n=1 Tax=Cypionkella sp. TaxID=2811411 RepID=UPI00260FE645|nr:DUF922 domain-containing protein [Cypionkella sp.]MDB5659235.1 hypothetical protein [Cypionkella sp.]